MRATFAPRSTSDSEHYLDIAIYSAELAEGSNDDTR
jgi:hypothetical protein